MNCDELKKMLPEYFDGSLERKDAREFERHLEKCPEVKLELARLKILQEKFQKLPLSFDPPDDIISEITERLMELVSKETDDKELSPKEKKKRKKEEAKLAKHKKKFKKSHKDSVFTSQAIYRQRRFTLDAGSLAIILIILFIAAMFYYLRFYRSSTEPWKIRSKNVTYFINGNLSKAQDIVVGDKISVGDNSEVSIVIKDQCELTLYPNSEATVIKAREGNNVIDFETGKLLFNTFTIEPNFVIRHKSMFVFDKQSRFHLEVMESGDVKIEVQQGFIEVTVPGDRIMISNDYFCTIKNASIIEIPYHRKATEKLKSSLEYLESNKHDVGALSTILIEAGEFDALTLLRLIETVPPSSRDIIFQKISNLYPPPEDVTKEGIINLDKEMLDMWWYEIEWQF